MSVLKELVIVVVMKSCSSRTTSANRMIRLDPTAEVLLLTVVFEERLELTFSLAWLDIYHDVAMSLACN